MTVSEQDSGSTWAEALKFFQRAEEVAATDNFDYAIDMFLEGLKRAPEAVDRGHKRLRYISLIRQGKKGKKPSIVEKLKRSRAKNPLEQMLNAEYLLAKDPDNLQHAVAMMKAAAQSGYKETTEWIADLVFQAHRVSGKASVEMLLQLRDSYAAVNLFDKALAACEQAVKLKPDEGGLRDEIRNLSAQLAVQRGRYDKEGDFRHSIKDRAEQERLQAQESVVKTQEFRVSAVSRARKAFEENPNLPMNIIRLADALSDMADDAAENEAIGLLEKTYSSTKDFAYKRHAGQIRLKQLGRRIRAAKEAVDSEPDNAQAKERLNEASQRLNAAELEHYRLCVENYPTDLRVKFDFGLCLMRNKRYDDAIPMFQEARRDPRCAVKSMDKMGVCFFVKGWLEDAIDIFKQAINSYEIKDDAIAKELRYNLARAYEEKGRVKEALELYRKLAQIDYAYKDVRQRVDKLRDPPKQPGIE